MIPSKAAEQLQARLNQVNAKIEQATAQAAAAASQPAPAPAAPEHAATPGSAAPAGRAFTKNAAGLSFVTGTASNRLTERAAAAVPGAVTEEGGVWATVGGHAEPGFIEIQGAKRSVAYALEIPDVRDRLETAEAIVLNLCHGMAKTEGLPSVAEQFAAATGKPVLATDQQVIVAGTEVVSGQIAYDDNGLPKVVPGGTWKVLENGNVRDLQTPSLLKAYDKLGLTPLLAMPAPAEIVAFNSTQQFIVTTDGDPVSGCLDPIDRPAEFGSPLGGEPATLSDAELSELEARVREYRVGIGLAACGGCLTGRTARCARCLG